MNNFVSLGDRQAQWVERAARFGLGARAGIYLLISALLLLALQAPGTNDGGKSPSDAFLAIESAPLGHTLLILTACGLFAYVLFRLLQAICDLGDHGTDKKGLLARLGMVSSAVSYATVAAAAVTIILNSGSGSDDGLMKTMSSALLGVPFGRLLIILAGIVIVLIGCAQIWRVVRGQWRDNLEIAGRWRALIPVAAFGISGRGLLFGLIGLSLIWSGFVAQPDEALGLSALLGYLRDAPFGAVLYGVAALIVGGYGLYGILQTATYSLPERGNP
jgi:hypothetical protein